jgi:hypothetical protein
MRRRLHAAPGKKLIVKTTLADESSNARNRRIAVALNAGGRTLPLFISIVAEIQPRGRHMDAIGRKRWAIAEGYIPSQSSFSDRSLISHETACILNAGDQDAHVSITLFFVDREPLGPYQVTVAARRTLHLRFNDLKDPAPVPYDTDYSSVFESDVPIVLQHTRLDSRHAEVSVLSTTAYAEA